MLLKLQKEERQQCLTLGAQPELFVLEVVLCQIFEVQADAQVAGVDVTVLACHLQVTGGCVLGPGGGKGGRALGGTAEGRYDHSQKPDASHRYPHMCEGPAMGLQGGPSASHRSNDTPMALLWACSLFGTLDIPRMPARRHLPSPCTCISSSIPAGLPPSRVKKYAFAIYKHELNVNMHWTHVWCHMPVIIVCSVQDVAEGRAATLCAAAAKKQGCARTHR